MLYWVCNHNNYINFCSTWLLDRKTSAATTSAGVTVIAHLQWFYLHTVYASTYSNSYDTNKRIRYFTIYIL